MANFKNLGVLLVLTAMTGCAQVISGDTQDVVIETGPKSGAQCMLQNGRGSWSALSTPATVTLLRSTTPLTVNCRTNDGWTGTATVNSTVSLLTYADAVTVVGAAYDTQSGAAYDYPGKVMVAMAMTPETQARQITYGANGGRGIAAPIDASDRARMADDAIATRFQTLRVLLDEGLITTDEYNSRRGANVGALLRYSMVPPARDLARAAPPPQQLVARMRYLAAAYAEHSITAGEHAAERSTILDGLLPLNFIKRADPPPPIKDQLQMAAEMGRIERLLTAHVISEKEAAAERAKVAGLLETAIATEEASARAAAGMAISASMLPAPSSGIGVALSTHASESQAKRIWAGLQKTYPAELGKLKMSVKKITQPHGRPSHYRITAGPLPDYGSAETLCKSMTRHEVACEATSFAE